MSEKLDTWFDKLMVRLFGWHPSYGFLINWDQVEHDMRRNEERHRRRGTRFP